MLCALLVKPLTQVQKRGCALRSGTRWGLRANYYYSGSMHEHQHVPAGESHHTFEVSWCRFQGSGLVLRAAEPHVSTAVHALPVPCASAVVSQCTAGAALDPGCAASLRLFADPMCFADQILEMV